MDRDTVKKKNAWEFFKIDKIHQAKYLKRFFLKLNKINRKKRVLNYVRVTLKKDRKIS